MKPIKIRMHISGFIAGGMALLAIFFLSACSKPDEPAQDADADFQEKFATSERYLADNRAVEAIPILESLEQRYPERSDITEQLAFAYYDTGDAALAAIYFQGLYADEPERSDYILYAAQAYLQAGQPDQAIQSYQQYLEKNPSDAINWQELARLQVAEGDFQAAAQSYAEAVERLGTKADGDVLLTAGRVGVKAGKIDQAEAYFQQARSRIPQSATDAAIAARLGLIETAMRRQNWALAWSRLQALDTFAPTALDNSSLAYIRPELEQWHREHLATELAAHNAEAAQAALAANMADVAEAANTAITAQNTNAVADARTVGDADANNQINAAIEAAEPETALQLAKAADGGFTNTHTPTDTTGGMNAGGINHGSASDSADSHVNSEESSATSAEPVGTRFGSIYINDQLYDDDLKRLAEARQREQTLIQPTLRQLADTAYDAADYETAAKHYQQAFAETPLSGEIADRLSRCWYQLGHFNDAEIYASEAVRLDRARAQRQPSHRPQPAYTIQYLRVIQKSQPSHRLLMELIKAKERFPNNPDITLALGRAYELIQGSRRNARIVYEEFLQMAPEHPRAAEIRQKLTQL